jgi:hypothetical protein
MLLPSICSSVCAVLMMDGEMVEWTSGEKREFCTSFGVHKSHLDWSYILSVKSELLVGYLRWYVGEINCFVAVISNNHAANPLEEQSPGLFRSYFNSYNWYTSAKIESAFTVSYSRNCIIKCMYVCILRLILASFHAHILLVAQFVSPWLYM